MFRRAVKQSVGQKIKEAVWPSMGWRRAFDYWWHRVFRTGDSTYRITAGLASGVAVSFNPFLGTHVFQGFFVAWLVRANWIAAFIGTGFGNTLTMPFLLWLAYMTGAWILGVLGLADAAALPHDFTFSVILDEPLRLLLPLTLGGYTCGLIAWLLTYGLLYFPVRTAQRIYRANRLRRTKAPVEQDRMEA